MERLFYFLYQYRAFFIFLLLEVFCSWLIIQNNQYQGAQFFNSSNRLVAGLNSFSQDVREYFSLREINRLLAEENAKLHSALEHHNQTKILSPTNQPITDTLLTKRFEFVSAKVVNNSVHRFTNYITINKGEEAGLARGMAVISPKGIVGKIKTVSSHYSVVASLLHKDVMVSAVIKRTGHFGTIHWSGFNPDYINLNSIPRHVKPLVGDSIVTSGYNAVYPEGIMIGIITDVKLNKAAQFYQIDVKLSQDFRTLSYVSVVKSIFKSEQDSLEHTIEILNR